MNAIDFLIKEHNTVRGILMDISDESHTESKRKELFSHLVDELIRHENMEQKVWYPYFRDHPKLEDEVKHLVKEENHAEKALNQLDAVKNEEEWKTKFKKLKEDIEHHAEDEEKKLFPNVKKIFDDAELEEIGRKMQEFKKQYKANH